MDNRGTDWTGIIVGMTMVLLFVWFMTWFGVWNIQMNDPLLGWTCIGLAAVVGLGMVNLFYIIIKDLKQ